MRGASSLRVSLLVLVAAGCSKAAAPAPDPAFESQFAALTASGVTPITIEGTGGAETGEALMGSVRRITKPEPSRLEPSTAPTVNANDPLPPSPSGEDVSRIVRTNVQAVRGCYATMARAGVQRSGKAIVSFVIGADGRPANVKVEAPAFSGTSLPSCVSSQIGRWSFPRSQNGGGAVSYPFVFVGG